MAPPALRRVFLAARRVAKERRAAFVTRICGGDDALAREVMRLLESEPEAEDSFLRPPTALDARVAEARATSTASERAAGKAPVSDLLAASLVGSLLAGRYRVGPQIDAGGAGTVFEAKDSLTGADVAVKIVPASRALDLARARREVATLRWLRLPGVVRLLDDGVEDGQGFIVMDRVRGTPFPGVASPAPWEAVRHPIVALFETLARIHWAGVVHGDLKPSNVLVGEDGLPVVLDLGLSSGPEVGPRLDADAVAGTPRYLAPEQIHGRPPSAASDLYALGCMLYETLSGKSPHDGATWRELFADRCARPAAPLADLAPSVPRPVAYLVDRLLQADPAARPPSARAALALLQRPLAEVAGAEDLPWVGPRGPIEALLAAARSGRSADLAGPRGSGRTRVLAEAAAALAREGRTVLRLEAGARPFESLRRVLGEPPAQDAATAEQAQRAMEWRLSARLAAGDVVLADDADALDRLSAAALDACRAAGTVWRAFRAARPGATGLGPVAEADLQALFAGTNRIHHVPEDAAHELFVRTGGLAARVVSELTAWERAGLARREGDRFVITRDAIERLRAGLWVAAHATAVREGETVLDPALDDVLVAIDLARSAATVDVLAAALERPRWVVEADVAELERLGTVHRDDAAHLRSTVPTHGGSGWTPERRLAVHRAMGYALPADAETRVYHLLAGGAYGDVSTAAVAACRRLRNSGQPDRAVAIAVEGIRIARDGIPASREDIVVELLQAALQAGTRRVLEIAIHHVGPLVESDDVARSTETILRAGLATVDGDSQRALAVLAELPQHLTSTLERCRWSVRVVASRYTSLLEERETVTAASRVAAADPALSREFPIDEWMGWLRYREGRYGEAAEFHERSARAAGWEGARAVPGLLNAASARLEAGDHAAAQRLARSALDLVRPLRHPLHEARAERLLRAGAYRGGTAREPDSELIEAVPFVGNANVAGLILLNEAAIAWRARALEAARRLATMAAGVWGQTHQVPPTILARALALVAGAADSVEAITASILADSPDPIPGLTVQSCGLLALASPEAARSVSRFAFMQAREIPEAEWNLRREVLSIAEANSFLAEAIGPSSASDS